MMITKEQVDALLNPLGFTVFCYDGNHNPTYMDSRGITIYVNLADNSFRLKYVVDQLFILDSQTMSPLISDIYNQFDKMYTRFLRSIAKLG